MKAIRFSDWLASELAKREWTQNKLARKTNLSKSEVSRIIHGKQPSTTICRVIAQALNIPFDVVLIQAGILDRPPDYDERDRRVLAKFKQLSPVNQREIEKFMDIKLELQTTNRNDKK